MSDIEFPVNLPSISEDDILSVTGCLKSTWISGESPIIGDFENNFAQLVNVKYAIAVSNGSTALELAFAALDLPKGSEVILPSLTIISCLAPLLRMGLKPIFVDSDLQDWNMLVDETISKITNKTKVILVVHTYGLAAQLVKLTEVCKEKNIVLIEDCAEALGVEHNGQACGSIGDIATFSFYSNKLITTGEGGMCTTNSDLLAARLRKLRNLGFEPDVRFKHLDLGYNFRMSGMQAALGISQLKNLKVNLEIKKSIAKRYIENLKGVKDLTWQPLENQVSKNAYWVFGLVNQKTGISALQIQNALSLRGVASRPFFYPLHMQPLLKNFDVDGNQKAPNAEFLWQNGFYLPSGNGYKLEQIDEISARVLETFAELGLA
jgi:perosamine synthetase